MSLSNLTRVTAPPDEPVHSGTEEQWKVIEQNIGITFPEEYFDLSKAYGSGEFLAGTLEMANPFDPTYDNWLEYEISKLRNHKESFPDEITFPLFPEEGGLFPFGRDDNGNRFYWETSEELNIWPIICRSEAYHWDSVHHSLSTFLELLITNKLEINRSDFWGSEFPREDWLFEPKRPKKNRKGK